MTLNTHFFPKTRRPFCRYIVGIGLADNFFDELTPCTRFWDSGNI